MRASKNLRIQRLQERTILGPHERLLRALVILNRTADQLQLPDQTRDHAAFIVKRILPNYRRGLWVGHLVTAALTLAVRQHRLPVLEADILKFIPLRKYHKTRLNRIKWQVVKSLDIKWPCSQPQWFVPRIISCIRSNSKACEKLSQEDLEYDYFHWLERTAVLILGRVELTNRRGANPAAIAASLVYSIDFKSLHITTQAMVGEAIGFSENSIRDHHRYIWRDRIEAIIKDIGGEMTGE
jgi:transcription initiation factor TFIIIB Brf1 subunit/transcription initiation factor TFIIB